MSGSPNTSSFAVTVKRIAAVLLPVSVAGCASCPPTPVVPTAEYRPPSELMRPAPTQYLLPENLRRP